MTQRKSPRAALLAACFGLIAACGGGTDGTGSPVPPAAGITTSGVMTKGSVIVNGVRFDDSAATVTDDRGRTASDLANGMVVKLRGRRIDGSSGIAERIDVENELRAAIASINPASSPPSFVAAGITVLVESGTVFVNAAGFAALSTGARVEVHGLRDAGGNLHASRVELVGAGPADEVRGAASSIDVAANTFVINGSITVNYARAAFSPAGTGESSLRSGTVVEVRGTLAGNVFTATQVDFEDLKDDSLRGRTDEEQEVEGFVSGFTAHPGSFLVNGRSVTTTSSTRFEGGTSSDLVNNVKVELEGIVNAQGVLVASKVEFRTVRVQLRGRATAVDAGAGTIVVLGQTVRSTNLTRIETRSGSGGSTSLADVVPNVDCVEVRATVDGSSIVAEEIKEPDSCGKELVQAAVSAKNESTFTLTFFGALRASLADTPRFLDRNEQAISRAQFFAAVVPASATSLGTLVEVEGNSLGAVEKAQFED
ncbi:MAG: DUF5666 domain-containing protein [Burkholderiaceae bacterium]